MSQNWSWNFPWNLKQTNENRFFPCTSFYKHFMKQSLQTSQPHWTFPASALLRASKHIGTSPGPSWSTPFLPNLFEKSFTRSLRISGSFFWFQFNQEVYSSVAATCIFLMMLLEQHRKQKSTWAWFLCTNVLVEIEYKPYNPDYPYDAPPPSSSSSWLFYLWYRWDVCPSTISITVILAKGAQETANIWKNGSPIQTPPVPNYIE